eukprot:11083552-Alexandrium_andersonii.AAC.1
MCIRDRLTLVKVHTSENPADLFTKHPPDKTLQRLRAWAGVQGATAVNIASPSGCRISAPWLHGVDLW